MKRLIVTAIAAAAATLAFSSFEAGAAPFTPAGFDAPNLVEQAACVTKRIRTVRPNGRVVHRRVRKCGPHVRRHRVRNCRLVRERVYRPNGNVVLRTVRRCR